MSRTHRYYFKKITIFTCYDRLTGTVIGDTLNEDRLNADILGVRGLSIDERIDSGDAKIPIEQEEAYHYAVAESRFKLKKL